MEPTNLKIQEQFEQPVNISLKTDSEREQRTQKMLEQLLIKYSLKKWIYTKEVIIEEGAIPHSDPILTLNVRPETEEVLLAQFLHEQIHWIEDGHRESMNQAIEELKVLFPTVPVGKPEGARDEKSSYRHLIICRLELLALGEYIGKEEALQVVLNNPGYKWISRTMIDRGSEIDLIIEKYFPESLAKVVK